MKYPIDAVEACEALSHPVPFPGMESTTMATRRPIWPTPAHEASATSAKSAKSEAEELGARIDAWIAAQHAAQRACVDAPPHPPLFQKDGGRKVDTTHPGPIVMFEPADESDVGTEQAQRHTKRQYRLIAAAIVLALVSAAAVIHDMATTGKAPTFPF